MKKHLLFLSLVLASMSAYANTAVFDFTGDEAYGMPLLSGSTNEYNPNPTECQEGDVTMTINGKSRWWAAGSGNELRMYKESNFTISVPSGYHISDIALDAKLPGSFAGDGYVAPNWSGSLAAVTINCTVASGNTPIYKVTVTYAEGDPTGEVTPTDPVAEWGKYGLPEDMLPGKYLIYANDRVATPNTGDYGYLHTTAVDVVDEMLITTKNAYAFEFIPVDGGYNIKDSNGRYLYQKAEYDSFNYANSVTAGDDSFVWLVEDGEESSFHIYNSATDKSIYFSSEHNTFGAFADFGDGYVRPLLFQFIEDTTEPDTPQPPVEEPTAVNALNDVYTLANNEKIKVNCELIILYAHSPYYYVMDESGTGHGLIYKADLGLEDKEFYGIEGGWTGKVSIYNNLYEIVPDVTEFALSEGPCVGIKASEITADNVAEWLIPEKQNCWGIFKSVVFDVATPAADAEGDDRAYTGTMGDVTVNFFQRFGIESVEGGTYDVVGFISVYKDTVQVQPTHFTPAAGIAGITADNAPVVYYNLQGVRIANPTPGTPCIRVQGTNATKIIK